MTTDDPRRATTRRSGPDQELAKEATEGPWRATTCLHMDLLEVHDVVSSDGSGQLADTSGSLTPKADADWIATMSPVIAGPLVEWLREEARLTAKYEAMGPTISTLAALALADAILGGSTT